MDQLVTLVAAATQGVQHRVYHRVQDTHTETGDERAQYVNAKTLGITGEHLDAHADKADDDTQQGRFLVTDFLDELAGRDTHEQVSGEVGEVTQHSLEVRRSELILQYHPHRGRQVRDERDHRE